MRTAIFALLLLFIAACAPQQESGPSLNDESDLFPEGSLEEPPSTADVAFNTDCDLPVDPQVMLDAFPTTVKGYVQVGETIAERSEMPLPEGITYQSTALRTLTVNDEKYISFSGTDACGFNTNILQISILEERNDEYGWSKKVTVAGYPGWIVYDTGANFYDVYVLLKDRILIDVNNDESEEVALAAASAVDYASIERAS